MLYVKKSIIQNLFAAFPGKFPFFKKHILKLSTIQAQAWFLEFSMTG